MEARVESEQFSWVGGREALDLLNTLAPRGTEGGEGLATPDDLYAWAAEAGLIASDAMVDDDEAEALLPEVYYLRTAIGAAVEAVVNHVPVPAEALALINAWLDQPRERPHLLAGVNGPTIISQARPTPTPGRLSLVWGVEGPLLMAQAAASPLHAAYIAVAEDAARLLGTGDRARIRICANPACRAYFHDRSQAGRRRWCDMTRCGNVAKVQRYRQRHLRLVEPE